MKIFFLASCFTLMIVASTNAASTGWIDGTQYHQESRKIAKSKLIPVSIKCKAGNTVGQTRKNTMLKIEYGPNGQKTRWRMAWGDQVAAQDRKLKKKGFKIASSSSFRRASGLRIKCAIWHR